MAGPLRNRVLEIDQRHVIVLKHLGAVLKAILHIAVNSVVELINACPVILRQCAVTGERHRNNALFGRKRRLGRRCQSGSRRRRGLSRNGLEHDSRSRRLLYLSI